MNGELLARLARLEGTPPGSMSGGDIVAALDAELGGTDWRSGGGATVGEAVVDFGAFPGKTDATVTVTGQAGILSTSTVQAWIVPKATTDHSADEHVIDAPEVLAGAISAGVGFTIYAAEKRVNYPPQQLRPINQPRTYGKWSVAWSWS